MTREWGACFYETGTGKTCVAIETFKYWQTLRNARRIVAVVPNSLTGNWVKECEIWGMPRAVRAVGDREARIKLIKSDAWDVLIINYESMRTPEIVQAIIDVAPQGLAFDEIQRVKDRTAKQTKGSRRLSKAVKDNGGCRIGLTGTPVVQSPFDLWSIFDVLEPGATPKTHPLGYGNYQAFETGVCIKKPHPRLGWRVPMFEYPDEKLHVLKCRVAPEAREATKADCLDLPDRTFNPPVLLDMQGEQSKVYKSLKDDYICFLDGIAPSSKSVDALAKFGLKSIALNDKALEMFGGPQAGGEHQVSALFATTLMMRLQQVASGFVKTDDGDIVELPNAKGEWLSEYLPMLCNTSGDHKCVIMCRFIHDVEFLKALSVTLGIGAVSLSGANSSQASEVVEQFQNDKSTRLFIGNVAVASAGITLTAADSMVFYNNSFSNEHRMQAKDRIFRIGQKRNTGYYDLTATLDGKPTVDGKVLLQLDFKGELATKTVSGLRAVLL